MHSFSKWLEVIPITNVNSISTIRTLKHCLTTLGYHEVIASDNSSSFTSNDYKLFVKSNDIKHINSAPYHTSTNESAERAVSISKPIMEKLADLKSMPEKLQMFLFQYHINPTISYG